MNHLTNSLVVAFGLVASVYGEIVDNSYWAGHTFTSA